MKLDNAIKLLGKYGTIHAEGPADHDGWCRYHAEVNGVNVNFVDRRTATVVTMPGTYQPPLTMAVEVAVTHDGPALRPTPHFHLVGVGTSQGIVSVDPAGPEALAMAMAEAVIEGQCDGAVLLDWLLDKSGDDRVQRLCLDYQAEAARRRQLRSGPGLPVDGGAGLEGAAVRRRAEPLTTGPPLSPPVPATLR